MICMKCKNENREQATFCSHCGAPMETMPPPRPPSSGEYGEMRGSTFQGHAVSKKYAVDRNPFVAAMIALIPSAGQIYNGDFKKALACWVAIVFLLAIDATFYGALLSVPVSIAFYIWSIVDAYKVAARQKERW